MTGAGAPRAPHRHRIIHVFRAPLGGLFRHVLDLAEEQAKRGHDVGLVCDATPGSDMAESRLADARGWLTLGLTRLEMSRAPGLGDIGATRRIARELADKEATVVHGHGAKGGAYARLAPPMRPSHMPRPVRVYTPHGGSLHFSRKSPKGFVFLGLERLLMPLTDLFLFESAFSRDATVRKIGRPAAPAMVIHNGLRPDDFAPAGHAAGMTDDMVDDVVFIGELRDLKGVDTLIDAGRHLARDRPISMSIVGSGPDADALRARAEAASPARIRFHPPEPARTAFGRGRVVCVPSRAESLPYIVLEAIAAGKPIVATRVGGIPEIFGADRDILIPPDAPDLLAAGLRTALDGDARFHDVMDRVRQNVRANFTIAAMTDRILSAYETVSSRRMDKSAPIAGLV